MFQALFNSLSGLFSFSRSLDTVSNNVANMNTPGFRGSDSFFENIAGEHGARITGQGMRTGAGDMRQTGNSTDVAVEGGGFFVLRDLNGSLHYTRAGQFIFDEQGILIDSVSRFQVMGIDQHGNLAPVSLEGQRTLPAQATTRVTFSGNLQPDDDPHEITVANIYTAAGASQSLKIKFTKNPDPALPRSLLVTITDATGAQISSGELRFSASGFLEPGYNTLTAQLTVEGVTQELTFDFGVPGAFQGTTHMQSIATNIGGTVADGRPVLGITTLQFDDKGVLQMTYSANEKRQGARLALASFHSESLLELRSGRLISDADAQRSELGRAGEGVFGRIHGGSLEMSNIDLTQEFADMLIIQRGYQASSRVMTVSNEMIEQLYNSTRGG
ncbi:flagellar hook-basal body complex protein [Pseudoxanthomonas sp. PXM02]|uniref:flagellar hook-basal body complex protein n=1 Tax=Pseudoxanthomonas sp. PXM02 TaxID=2769294 RepID=UPI00177C576F|nr:flagellar hook-basal body complex protein [Pseudoxanthomonas sp. PXM02]MBD9477415.1 flagellar hook-basal body complex protein [Pseudoxanthomonas sp. PXM02]